GTRDDLVAGGPERDGCRDRLRAAHLPQVCLVALRLALAWGLDGAGRHELAVPAEGGEELLEQRRLAEADVDEVEATGLRPRRMADDRDERLDRLRQVRTADVLARRRQPEDQEDEDTTGTH